LPVVDQDPADNKFIEAAVALIAKIIISGDKDLLALKEYFGLKILSTAEFLSVFKSSGKKEIITRLSGHMARKLARYDKNF